MLIVLYLTLMSNAVQSAALFNVANAEARVSSVIVEQDRRTTAREILREMRSLIERQGKNTEKGTRQVRDELMKRNPDRAAVEVMLSEQLSGLRSHNGRMLDLRFALRDHLTREEWSLLFPSP